MTRPNVPSLVLIGFSLGAAADLGLAAFAWGSATMSYEVARALPRQDKLVAMQPQMAPSGAAPLTDYSQTLTRPLFSRSRKPAPQADRSKAEAKLSDQSMSQAGQFPSGVLLSAVVVSSSVRRAFVTSKAQTDWVSEGDNVNGWLVTSIDGDGIVLRNGNRNARVNLYVDRSDSETRLRTDALPQSLQR